jgi:hypothetical protein
MPFQAGPGAATARYSFFSAVIHSGAVLLINRTGTEKAEKSARRPTHPATVRVIPVAQTRPSPKMRFPEKTQASGKSGKKNGNLSIFYN